MSGVHNLSASMLTSVIPPYSLTFHRSKGFTQTYTWKKNDSPIRREDNVTLLL